MRRPAVVLGIAVALAGAVVPGAVAQELPRPAGWIGTTEQWAQGLGIALAVLNLLILGTAWRRMRRSSTAAAVTGILFFGLAVLPLVVIFFGYTRGMAGMEAVSACGGCHVMTAHVQDLRNPDGEGLAAVHYKNRYILRDQCYTCHSDYGMLGTVSAKMDGLRHVAHYLTGRYAQTRKIFRPYSNVRCLTCHAESRKFLDSPGHPEEDRATLFSGEVSCLDCHAPAHTPKVAAR